MKVQATNGDEADLILARLANLAELRKSREAKLAVLERSRPEAAVATDDKPTDNPVTDHSSSEAKIALFRSLFARRKDLFPRRWENAGTGKAG